MIILKILMFIVATGCLWVWFLGFSAIGREIQHELDAEFERLHPNWDKQRKSIKTIEKEWRART